jgi:hypothetical protein
MASSSDLNLDSENLKHLFREIGLYNTHDQLYFQRAHKHKQVLAYIIQIKAALEKLSKKRPITLIDCGCGKSYLAFILYDYCKTILNRQINIIGIDTNQDLINKCKLAAKELNFVNMDFIHSNVATIVPNDKVDIVYSLHACDTATDQTIAKGIEVKAQYIFSVSCCQHTNRNKIANHPLTSISRHQPYKERLVDMVGDSMRALLLEHLGYGVKLFEFVAAEATPKNIMLRAIKKTANSNDMQNALTRYKELTSMFNFVPALANMIKTK